MLTLGATVLTSSAPAEAGPFKYPYGPHPHHWGYGWGAAALVGGLALGALAAQSYNEDCGYVRQPIYDVEWKGIGDRAGPAV